MDRRFLLGIVAAVVLLAGCAKAAPAAKGGGDTGAPSAKPAAVSSESRGKAKYEALAPESAAEKQVVASIGDVYAAYLKAPAPPGTPVYRKEGKVEPLFIGYEVRAYSAKKANGKYDSATLLVLGGTVTSEAAWEKAGEMTLADVNPQYFVYELPSDYRDPLPATTAREKEAVAKAKAWLSKNFADKKLDRVDLAAYTFVFGQPADEHWLLLQTKPGSPMYEAVAQ